MGAKTALLAYAAGDPVESLRRAREYDPAATRALVAATHPAWDGTASSRGDLSDQCYPPEGVVYAGSFPGIDILCDRDVMDHLPSQFPTRYLDAAAGRRVILHAMHSVSDTFAYAVWEDGSLVRSLCLSPDDGITENIGDPLPFEAPYWAGEHPAGDRYPLPFHPLRLGGETVLRAFFGFSLAGRRQPADVDAESVKLAGFQVPPANPITKEMLAEFMRTRRRTTYRLEPGGKLIRTET
ncbi:MAG TPA: hypothetical protein VKU77_24445 [Streptosporangiaceae bacterium]|nr:hypothetical protein [Streptosporangiaceae bacterium]